MEFLDPDVVPGTSISTFSLLSLLHIVKPEYGRWFTMPHKKMLFQLCFHQAEGPAVMGINGYGIPMKLILSVPEAIELNKHWSELSFIFSKCKVKIKINKGRLRSFLFPSCLQ